jgi:CheY-like chemotaxis protein
MRDTGVGMDAQTLARTFEPFFTTKPHGQGSGLGLATAYGIVKQSFGDIRATSDPGLGSTFEILLPVARGSVEPPKAAPPRVSPTHHPVVERRSVLLVEDDDGVREFAQKVLRQAGYEVHAARNGIDALAQMENGALSFDVVVTDVIMPEMGGRALVGQLRRREVNRPVIYITGYTDDTSVASDLLGSQARLLEKPFSARALEVAVAEALQGVDRAELSIAAHSAS